ncbi:glycosyltransferase [Rhodoligotrophos ferricapiens]|uniref:glycosyltransferase n=1 Tax=Rhodoligotrophos ferricapiens TaxID=3069264 RepID=UPI00315D3E37
MVQRKILLGWEMGGGLGHVIPLQRIGERLKALGHHVVYCVQNQATALKVGMDRGELRQAPHWTHRAQQPPLPPGYSGFTFGQILALFGVGERETTARMLREWTALLEAERPDVVVSDFAPGLNLAARGRYPLLVFGNGYTHPPDHLDAFPRLWPTDAKPYYDEAALLESLDALLSSEGRPRLERFPAIMAGDASAVRTFPLLDPYRAFRKAPTLAPILSHVPSPIMEPGEEILCSILPRFAESPEVLRALASLDLPGRLLASALGEGLIAPFEQTPWRIERTIVDFGPHLRSFRMVIGYGGLGLTSLALAAGLPQLILYTDSEKLLTGRALEHAGVARAFHYRRIETETLVKTAARLYVDPQIHARARELARAHAPLLASDPITSVADMVQGLLS